MQITDPIADMLTRIRNANNAKHDTVDVPASNMKKSIAQILLDEGYIKNFQLIDDGTQGVIRVTLKYGPGKEKVISGLRRVSKPGLRVYAGAEELPKVLRGLGIAIVSTSKGVMTDKKARQAHVGGDLPRGDHRLVLQRDGLLPLFDIVGFGLAVDLLVFAVVGVESRAAHLARHQVARERHDADVVARRRFDGHDVAPFEVEVVDVLVERTAGVLETHLDDVARHVDRVLVEPGRFVELEAPVAEFGFRLRAAVAKGAPAAHFGFAGARMSFFGIHDWV